MVESPPPQPSPCPADGCPPPERGQPTEPKLDRWLGWIAKVGVGLGASGGIYLWCLSAGLIDIQGAFLPRHEGEEAGIVARSPRATHLAPKGSAAASSRPCSSAPNPALPPASSPVPDFASLLRHGALVSRDQTAALPIDRYTHWLGRAGSPVTVVVFGDTSCPLTRRMMAILVSRLATDEDAFRLVYRHRPQPIHPGARQEALALEQTAASQGEEAFWRALWETMVNGDRRGDSEALGPASRPPADLPKNTRAASTETEPVTRLAFDERLAWRYAVRKTPTLFQNGLRWEGDAPITNLWEQLASERAAVEALRASGADLASGYDARVSENLLGVETLADDRGTGSLGGTDAEVQGP